MRILVCDISLIRKPMQHAQCQNVNDHGIHASILVTDGPRGRLGADVSHEACMDVLTQVGHQSKLSSTLIHLSNTNISTCSRSRTSAHTVVPEDNSCPTPTATEATGSRPMLSSIPIPIAAKLEANIAGLSRLQCSLGLGNIEKSLAGRIGTADVGTVKRRRGKWQF